MHMHRLVINKRTKGDDIAKTCGTSIVEALTSKTKTAAGKVIASCICRMASMQTELAYGILSGNQK